MSEAKQHIIHFKQSFKPWPILKDFVRPSEPTRKHATGILTLLNG